MPALVAPTTRLHRAWLDAYTEWGPGRHEDGFGLDPADEVTSPAGFAAFVSRLARDGDVRYRWLVEDGTVLGGIALRHADDEYTHWAGHLGFGIRPTARGRGLATWALTRMLDEARALGLDRVLLLCDPANTASAKTIQRAGGVCEQTTTTRHGPVRRFWIDLSKPDI
ncbi:GNAT family N-acetyltransferase [Amycolatopsis sp. FDAARGOS 1241]|uniref:GNAT family N-acetyltransferase n=1 Tax=Amycolatopsis sp. FDAARGOS 1241 TaxID=2778070 RepID=UPI0019520679|nr:GNAT family N-acetyltransferase [Amycolatopsis sp. FDAARGOS 1241]QRP44607.1 GNAT family N-acetyltransferase [Amycolatopsis sp. FDAARGOS 1241]